MTVTTTRLTQAAAVATVVAGTIFVLVQINHPPTVLASATTTDWFVRNAAKAVMAVLALIGLTGIYLRQRSKVGLLGLAGYLLLGMGYFMLFGTEFVATIVVPTAAPSAPGYIGDVIAGAFGGKPVGDIGPFMTVFGLTAAGYAGGGLLFGIATYRAGILWKWAAALLAVGNVSTMLLVVLPSSFNRPLAVPTGIALIGLGVSLWRDQQRQERTAQTIASTVVPQPAAAVR
jgi:hypothetical protein